MCEALPHDYPDDCAADRPDAESEARRRFLFMGLAAIAGGGFLMTAAGCASSGAAGGQRAARAMPGPAWRPLPPGSFEPPAAPPAPTAAAPPPRSSSFPGVIARSRWTSAPPNLRDINRMGPINAITVHHDGMRPFMDMTESASASRLELIRRSHRDRQGWSDIGYHFAIDRSGRVYECRSISYQGAHVRNHNEGNIGVLLMGNFDEQSPTDAQLGALRDHVSRLMRHYNVNASRLRTHREWETAATACPGRTLQHYMDQMRSRRMFG